MKERVLLSWSGGKDSALALHEIRSAGQFDVVALITTVTETYDRISMHGVRRQLLEKQACSIGLPLEQVLISNQATNDEYERKMAELLDRFRVQGVETVAFGDIFLEDLKRYREKNLVRTGMRGIFPLWGRDSHELAHMFVRQGFRAVTTCVDSQILDKRYVGRDYDEPFLFELPPQADPCGENGEFHSFAYAGPLFRTPIAWRRGEVVLRDNRFYFCDLIPE